MSCTRTTTGSEAYAIFTGSTDEQISLRTGRDLGSDRWPLRVGPITTEIVSPLREWHLTCEPNESGIEFDLTYNARAKPFECRSPCYASTTG